jgi:hypothetical protein
MSEICLVALVMATSLLAKDVCAQPKTDALLQSIFAAQTGPAFTQVIDQPQQYHCQIIYTQINRHKLNRTRFKNYYFNYDPDLYFNPASMVKMPLAFLALEKLNNMKVAGVSKFTPIQYDTARPEQKAAYADTTSANGLPSIAHYIKRAFLISENDPYNRLYQFVGQRDINRILHNKGYSKARITRQFMGFTEEQNRHTNPIRFIREDGSELYHQRAAYNTDSFDFSNVIKLGKAHINSSDSLINEPFDFTRHNNISLEDFQQMLQSVLFPLSVPAKQRFNLTKDDRDFLLRYLSQYPSETDDPKYDTSVFYDSYVKFFFRDSLGKMPEHIRVFNKVGWSYGFLTDVSYVVDVKNHVEFMLAATVYVNSDGILNDGKYEYDSIGHPFLYELGQTIYQYELQRDRAFKPKLSNFGLQYKKRDPNDKRPSIKVVDN